MSWFDRFRNRRERDLDDEFRQHLTLEAQDRMEAGRTPEEAWISARRDFGNIGLVKETTREMWGLAALERLGRDLRYGSRALLRNPGFAGVAMLSLALGIGANTAVFSLLNAVVLKTLPVRNPEELVSFRHPSFSYPIFEQVRERAAIFSGIFAWDLQRFHVDWNGDPQSTEVLLVTDEFYPTLGVPAFLGRTIHPGEEGPVAVISYACWQRRFAGDPGIAGRNIRIDRVPVTIVGVAPPGFFGVAPGITAEITVPVAVLPRLRPQDADILQRTAQAWLHFMARLKPGVGLRQADASLQVFWPQVMEAVTDPRMPADRRQRYLSRTTGLVPAGTGYSRVRNEFSQPLWLLLGLVALVLLVACATVANLLLARSSVRRREIAVRQALGASRSRLIRQLLTEALLLAGMGAACGILFAYWGARALLALLSTARDPIVLDLAPDWRVLCFTMAVAFATALLFALAPALRATRADPGGALKDTSRIAGRERWRLGKGLVVAQVALSLLLLAGAALFIRSLLHLKFLDPGFEVRNVLLVAADPLAAGYRGPRLAAFYRELLERLRSVPGVQSASLSWVPPVSNQMGGWTGIVSVDGVPQPGARDNTYFNPISPGYFATLGTPILQGRDFGPHDNESGLKAAIVNESLARYFFPGGTPIGRRISIGRDESRQDLEVVGVVKDAKYQYLQEPPRRIAYLPYLQLPEFLAANNLVAEVRTTASATADAIRREARALDAAVPVEMETLAARIDESLIKERVIAAISAFLAAIALILACAGLYGLMAYTVARRTNEIGIRMALGARERSVLWMVLRESLALAFAGVIVGLGASLALARLVASMLHGTAATDPLGLSTAAALMLAVAGFAGYLPARRASRIDPMVALREE